MKFLSIDTSTRYSVVSLSDEQGMVYGKTCLYEKGHSQELSGLIEHCVEKAKWSLGDITGFGVGIGPGSFTGLRVGVSTIKGLSYALKKPCYTFSSLDAIAFNEAACKTNRLSVIVDAKRSNIYSCHYKVDELTGALTRISEDFLMPVDSLEKDNLENISFSGDGVALYKEMIHKKIKNAEFISQEFWYPTPQSISRLVHGSYRAHKGVDCFKLGAVYLYAEDCQVSKKTSS